MRRKCSTRVGAIGLMVTAVGSAFLGGCSDDEITPGSGPDAATPDASVKPEAATSTLYTRLGGHAGIRSAVDAIVAQELQDPEIASFFVYQTVTPTPAGHPNADQLEECLTNQLGKAAGGAEVFPGALSAAHGGWTCRGDMMELHRAFHISGAQFDKFVTIAGTTLAGLMVAPADITAVANVLVSTRAAIVDPAAPGGPFRPIVDGGVDGRAEASLDANDTADRRDVGSTTDAQDGGPSTLYTRLGGHAGIRSAVDQVVGAELADPTIAPFFAAQVATPTPAGHPNADQLEECLTNQLASAAGGPEVYPLTLDATHGSWACRSMIAAHAAISIDSATFDKFVLNAATKLLALGVSPADVATIGTVLNGTKPDIVDSLYKRLGGHAGIRSAVDQVVAAELADPTIAPFFAAQVVTPTPADHPNADQLEECLTIQLASAAGGAERYPVRLDASHGSWQCRDMATAHRGLGISGPVFDKFVMIAAGKLTALGVASADVATIGTVLNSTKADVVTSDAGAADAAAE